MIKHYPNCQAPQDKIETIEIELEDGSDDVAIVCCDCGACEIIKKEKGG